MILNKKTSEHKIRENVKFWVEFKNKPQALWNIINNIEDMDSNLA